MSSEAQAYTQTTAGMKVMLLVASLLVLTIGVLLYLFPGRTDLLFSWTVSPAITAAFLGAAYLSACVLEFLSARERTWARARIAVPAVLLFTILTLVATLLHIDKFHFGPAFSFVTQGITWVWLVVYAVVPVAMSLLLVLQLRQAGTDLPRQAPMPGWIRLVFAGQAAVMVPLGIALFLLPKQTGESIWPWMLTPLTARAIGAWLVGVGVAAGHFAWEADWTRVRAGLLSYATFAALELVALLRFAAARSADYEPVVDWGGARAWIYLLFLLGILAAGTYGWWAARRSMQNMR
jgi:hypothetical protein